MGFFRKQPATAPSEATNNPRARILPAVRTATDLERHQLRRELTGQAPINVPSRSLAANLIVTLVEDSPNHMAFVDDEKLSAWNTTFDELYPIALDELSNDPGGEVSVRQLTIDGGDTFSVFGTDDYIGARLLTPGYFDRFGIPRSRIVVNPNRNVLIMCDPTNPSTITTAFDDVVLFVDDPSFISAQPIVGNGSEWATLELPTAHGASEGVGALTVIDRSVQANAVGPELQALVGDKVLVEQVTATEGPDGRPATMCAWHEGMPGLIAEADMIAFVPRSESEPIRWASWPDVVENVGHLMSSTRFEGRHKVTTFPDGDQIRATNAEPYPVHTT